MTPTPTPEQIEAEMETARIVTGYPNDLVVLQTATGLAIARLEGNKDACAYAERLAASLHGKYFSDAAPEWKPLFGDLVGLLTQIDNMIVGISETARLKTLDEAAMQTRQSAIVLMGIASSDYVDGMKHAANGILALKKEPRR